MAASLLFTGAGFDRSGTTRTDPEWVQARLADRTSRFVPVWRGQSLFAETEQGLSAVTPEGHLFRVPPAPEATTLLAVEDGIAYFAIELEGEAPLESLALDPAAMPVFQALLQAAPRLGHRDGALLAHAKGLLYWHQRHRFCGVCGAPTEPAEAGHVRRCTAPACGTSHFPRTDPAVIMLVTDGERVLLGRQKAWPKGMHSVLAGFVEPGESLEEAVAREVLEEAGIPVGRVDYAGSQPWPFPGSIMLGFRAEALSTELRIDPAELETARWVGRAELRAGEAGLFLPPRGAIAREMVEAWLAEG